MNQADILDICRHAATVTGIPVQLVVACAIAESNLNPHARRPADNTKDELYWPDVSGGLCQQTVRWDPEYHGGSTYPGPAEVERILALQYDPERSLRIAAANLAGKWSKYQPDLLAALCAYNFPAGGGRPASVAVEQNYRRGLAEAQQLLSPLGVLMPVPTYDPDTPLLLQTDDWSCFPTSLRMALESWGRKPTEAWIEQHLIADGIVSAEAGLLDGSGKAAAQWVTEQYGEPSATGGPALVAQSAASVSFDDVRSLAGTCALLLGGHHWGAEGHWGLVRRYNPATDVLELGNPAGSYSGISQTMSRQQFSHVAPCSVVMVRAKGAAPPPPPAPGLPTRAEIDALIGSLQGLRERLPV